MPKIPPIFVKGKINMLGSGEVAGQLLALVALLRVLLACSCSVKPAKRLSGKASDIREAQL